MAKTVCRVLLIVVAVLVVGLGVWIAWANKALQLNTYAVNSTCLPESFDGFRFAHISDLHNAEMGKDNEKLLALLRQAQPDMIAITGDMIDARGTDTEIALTFAAEAVKLAPCYYVPGNHEARIPEYPAFRKSLAALGVSVLENSSAPLLQNGRQILIAGVSDPSFDTDFLTDASAIMAAKLRSLDIDREQFTVLLSHRPELLDTYAESGAALVLTGHAHGGQIRLPFIGGVIAPNQGFFPEYDGGLYTQNGTTMIVSRGIGNSLFPLRINNRPEVVLITLHASAKG